MGGEEGGEKGGGEGGGGVWLGVGDCEGRWGWVWAYRSVCVGGGVWVCVGGLVAL